MLKTVIAVLMLSVSTLASADKFEYAELAYMETHLNSGIEVFYFFRGPERYVSRGYKNSVKDFNRFASQMGWERLTKSDVYLTDYLNPLGAEGWELVSSIAQQRYPHLYEEKYLFKRRID